MNQQTQTPERIHDYFSIIIAQLRENMNAREEDILKAWHENIAEAQTNEKKFPPLKLSISATVDLESNKIETSLKFSAVYSSSLSEEIPDPDQMQLILGEDSP